MDFYHDLVTQKSWSELTQLIKQVPFILIGGWAVYLYTKQLKSKDIDIIVTFNALSTLKRLYDVHKNDRLKKYEAIRGEIQIDIYLPHYSNLGIPLEDVTDKAREIDGFTVIDPNSLFVLKLCALNERGRAPKGRKDFLDLMSLFASQMINIQQVQNLIQEYNLGDKKLALIEFLQEHTQIPELTLNVHKYAKLKQSLLKYFKV